MNLSRSADLAGAVSPGPLKTSAVRALALGSLVALGAWSTAASAVTVVSPAANIAVPTTTAGIYINVVTGTSGTAAASPGWDINPWGSGSAFLYSASTGGIVTSTNSPVASLPVGTVIGSGSTFAASPGSSTFGSQAGQWTLNATNYFGFRFIGEDTLLHYGYGAMTVGATALNRTVSQIWYESAANTAITISPVPEPSSLALMLSGGALGALMVRRRRAAKR